MTKTRRRKLKSIIAELIACTLIAIAIFIKLLVPVTILILIIVSTHLTYEEFIQGTIVISITGALVAAIRLLSEPERSDKNGQV